MSKPQRHLQCRFFGVLLFFTCLTPEAYCVKVRGLNISQINAPPTPLDLDEESQHFKVSDNKRIDKMLEGYVFLTSSINPKVEIIFPEEDSSTQVTNSDLTDTDLESMDGKNANDQAAKIKLVFSLNLKPDQKNLTWNYLQKDEIPDGGDAQESFNENVCSKLAKDAFRIANAHENQRTRESTTCLCVTLRDKDQYAKKFVFHNGSDKMQASMAGMAHELGYDIKTGYQSHAEGEFIEFLLHRHKQNKERYTHILGMGCSKQHCKECDCLLQLFLGSNYHEFTAAMKKEKSPESGVGMPTIEELSQEEGDGVKMTVPEESQVFKVAHKKEAVQDKIYSQYRLSEDMQEEIKSKASLPNLAFSSKRFKIQDNVMERSERRRIQGGP